jgi:hypothetical protein
VDDFSWFNLAVSPCNSLRAAYSFVVRIKIAINERNRSPLRRKIIIVNRLLLSLDEDEEELKGH